tara:strand:- start:2133 stop:4793 length:2661 start_codon:yes stop_codon:yes gene_type:complete
MEMKKPETSLLPERKNKMSKNKSYLPNGGYTLTQGSNYMMDGFHFDTEYGGGPQEKARLPESKGLADLPSGMVPLDSSGISMLPNGVETEVDLNMNEITKESSQEINLVDHSWLASQPEPNLKGQRTMEDVYKHLSEGKFDTPEANQMRTLEESWGSTSTTGLDIIPNENRKHEPYRNPYNHEQSNLPGDDYRERVEKNIRKLAYGHPMNVVLSNVNETDILNVKSKIASEYGLHGRVYIKEEYFPGLFNGRWNEVINKRCATAMYIIPKNKDCAFDRFLGMKVVNEVPWKKAAKALLPKLESYGVKVASGSSKERLKAAFIDLIEGRVARQELSATWFPTQVDQSSFISLDHARRELESAREENIFVASFEDVEQSKIEKKLTRIANQLINQGLLDEEQVSAVIESNKDASKKINRLYELASTPTASSSYEGQGKSASYHNMKKHRTSSTDKVDTSDQRSLNYRNQKAHKKVAKMIQCGLVSIDEVERVTKKIASPEDKVRAIYKYLAQPTKTNTYMGGVEAHYMVDKSKLNPNAKFASQEEVALVKRTRIAMEKLSRMVKAGLISYEEIEVATKGRKTPEEKVASVFNYLAKPIETKDYDGVVSTAHIITAKNKLPTEKVNATSISEGRKIASKVDVYISNGIISEEDANHAFSLKGANKFKELYRLAVKGASAKKSEFKGQKFEVHIAKRASNPTKTAHEAQSDKIATWLQQKISEGSAGEELDLLLATRFSQNILESHSGRIASIRTEHEGLSGHVYVDAAAYMTKGTEGCDKGALVHRANQIPTLMKTSKCGSCVFNSGGSCQKYNKPIIASADEVVESPSAYQEEMIRLANASDSEQTASLFVNNYDANEFNLTASDNVFVDDAPSHEELGDVLFGGFEV